jgi:hypothetical protein
MARDDLPGFGLGMVKGKKVDLFSFLEIIDRSCDYPSMGGQLLEWVESLFGGSHQNSKQLLSDLHFETKRGNW